MKFAITMLFLAAVLGISGRKNRNPQEQPAEAVVKTPVTISVLEVSSISETIILNATSAYLKKNENKVGVSGYAEKVFINIGDPVKTGSPLFRIRTKEAAALGQDKACVLSDETMENFRVMQMINDTTEVKVPIKRGISTDNKIEILSPVFARGDLFVNSGSYGLPDTANIVISK